MTNDKYRRTPGDIVDSHKHGSLEKRAARLAKAENAHVIISKLEDILVLNDISKTDHHRISSKGLAKILHQISDVEGSFTLTAQINTNEEICNKIADELEIEEVDMEEDTYPQVAFMAKMLIRIVEKKRGDI